MEEQNVAEKSYTEYSEDIVNATNILFSLGIETFAEYNTLTKDKVAAALNECMNNQVADFKLKVVDNSLAAKEQWNIKYRITCINLKSIDEHKILIYVGYTIYYQVNDHPWQTYETSTQFCVDNETNIFGPNIWFVIRSTKQVTEEYMEKIDQAISNFTKLIELNRGYKCKVTDVATGLDLSSIMKEKAVEILEKSEYAHSGIQKVRFSDILIEYKDTHENALRDLVCHRIVIAFLMVADAHSKSGATTVRFTVTDTRDVTITDENEQKHTSSFKDAERVEQETDRLIVKSVSGFFSKLFKRKAQ